MCVVQYAVVAAGMCGFVLAALGLLYLCVRRIYTQTQSKHYSYTGTLAARRVLVAGSNSIIWGSGWWWREDTFKWIAITLPTRNVHISPRSLLLSQAVSVTIIIEKYYGPCIRTYPPQSICSTNPATMPRTCFTAPLPTRFYRKIVLRKMFLCIVICPKSA